MKRMILFIFLLAPLLAQGADWERLRAQDIALKARGNNAVTTITKAWADTRITTGTTAVVTFGNITMGADGGGARLLRLNSGAVGKYGKVQTDASGNTTFGAVGAALEFLSDADLDLLFDVGGLVQFRDRDGGYTARVTINSTNGDINNVAGAYKTGGTTRIASTGAATLTTATLSQALKLTPLASAPSAVEGTIYAGTDHHLRYYNGTAWVQLDN